METIHEILKESVSGGFWKFIGYWIMVALILLAPIKLFAFIVNRIMRHWNIRKHGYPPKHCDADGDFVKIEKNKNSK